MFSLVSYIALLQSGYARCMPYQSRPAYREGLIMILGEVILTASSPVNNPRICVRKYFQERRQFLVPNATVLSSLPCFLWPLSKYDGRLTVQPSRGIGGSGTSSWDGELGMLSVDVKSVRPRAFSAKLSNDTKAQTTSKCPTARKRRNCLSFQVHFTCCTSPLLHL